MKEEHKILIAGLILLTVVSALLLVFKLKLLTWYWGDRPNDPSVLGCPDCVQIKEVALDTEHLSCFSYESHYDSSCYSNYYVYVYCPKNLPGVDTFAGCEEDFVWNGENYYKYITPGDYIWSGCQELLPGDTIKFWGKCNEGWLDEARCSANIVQKKHKNKDCSITWQNYQDCDSLDGCKGTTYYDYYCSGGDCAYKTYPNDPRCAKPSGTIDLKFLGAIAGGLSILGVMLYLLWR